MQTAAEAAADALRTLSIRSAFRTAKTTGPDAWHAAARPAMRTVECNVEAGTLKERGAETVEGLTQP